MIANGQTLNKLIFNARAYNIQTLFSLSFYLPYMYRLEFDIDSVRKYIYA